MGSKLELRNKDFMQSIDFDAQRKQREDFSIEIRKQNRSDHAANRRILSQEKGDSDSSAQPGPVQFRLNWVPRELISLFPVLGNDDLNNKLRLETPREVFRECLDPKVILIVLRDIRQSTSISCLLAIEMSQLTCDICNSEFATCFCPCSFPNPRLCFNCCGKHSLHRLIRISQSGFVQTQDQYSMLLTRLSKLDQVKIHLDNDINQIAMWKARLQNSGINERTRTKNSQYLETLHRLLQQVFDSSLEDVRNNIMDENYQPSDDIRIAIWAFVIDAEAQFPSLLVNTAEAESQLATDVFHVEVKSLIPSLMQYRSTHKKPQGGIPAPPQSSNTGKINVEELKLRETSEVKAAPGPLHADLEALLVNGDPDAMRESIEITGDWHASPDEYCNAGTACFTLCGCFLCWPLIGYYQASVIAKLQHSSEVDLCLCLSCCAPTLCCCVGAALNRSVIRSKRMIEGSCCVDLLLYSLHVFNCCLIFQEMAEVGGI